MFPDRVYRADISFHCNWHFGGLLDDGRRSSSPGVCISCPDEAWSALSPRRLFGRAVAMLFAEFTDMSRGSPSPVLCMTSLVRTNSLSLVIVI